MPLIQGGPPEWIWERRPEKLKWEIVRSESPDGQTVYELRVNCGLEIMRLHFFSSAEMQELGAALATGAALRARWNV